MTAGRTMLLGATLVGSVMFVAGCCCVGRLFQPSTALHEAAYYGADGRVKRLLAEGHGTSELWGETAKNYLEFPCAPEWTPLHVAAAQGEAAVVALLIDAGADVNASSTGCGQTPLSLAVERRQGEWQSTVLLLLAAGADPQGVDLPQEVRAQLRARDP